MGHNPRAADKAKTPFILDGPCGDMDTPWELGVGGTQLAMVDTPKFPRSCQHCVQIGAPHADLVFVVHNPLAGDAPDPHGDKGAPWGLGAGGTLPSSRYNQDPLDGPCGDRGAP